jgi:hypothetical protein
MVALIARIDRIEATQKQIFGRETTTKQRRVKDALIEEYGRQRPKAGPAKVMRRLMNRPGFENVDRATFFRVWHDLGWSRSK